MKERQDTTDHFIPCVCAWGNYHCFSVVYNKKKVYTSTCTNREGSSGEQGGGRVEEKKKIQKEFEEVNQNG